MQTSFANICWWSILRRCRQRLCLDVEPSLGSADAGGRDSCSFLPVSHQTSCLSRPSACLWVETFGVLSLESVESTESVRVLESAETPRWPWAEMKPLCCRRLNKSVKAAERETFSLAPSFLFMSFLMETNEKLFFFLQPDDIKIQLCLLLVFCF